MKKLFIILLSLAAFELNAQDLPHFKRVVKELSSSRYQGKRHNFQFIGLPQGRKR